MLIETDRLIIRPFELSDAAAVLPFYGDSDTMRFLGNGQRWATDERTAGECLARTRAYYEDNPGYGFFALELKDSGGLAGHAALKPLEPDEIEVGWLVDRGLRGQGLATEAGHGVLEYAFEVLNLDAVVAVMFPHNRASQRVAERLGMEYQGMRQERDYTVAWYRMTSTEFASPEPD